MLGLFRKRRTDPARTREAAGGSRIYAIGDVHGCREQLDALLARIRTDAQDHEGDVSLVFVGDLVDRGPDSAGVIDRLLRPFRFAEQVHAVMGNHEEAMLAVYDGVGDVKAWLSYGGIETLESYGIDRSEQFSPGFDAAAKMHAAIPEAHIEFLRARPDSVQIGDYLFVHAGIRPGVPIDEQSPSDLRWIRNEFLASESDHGATVIHGHTIAPAPQSLSNRVGIDTGCYAGGPLTAVVLEGNERRFLQVEGYTG